MLDLIKSLIISAALAHNVSPQLMLHMANCESTFNPMAINKISNAQGLFQLLPGGELNVFYKRGYTNPFDPAQASNFTAEELMNNKGYLWSCYE